MWINAYPIEIKLIARYLKMLRVNVSINEINERLQDHPDWPSVLAISDTLTDWRIPNAAGKIDVALLNELPVPFLAFTQNNTNPLVLVTAVNQENVEIYQQHAGKPQIQSRDHFTKDWEGLYLIAEPNEDSGTQEYAKNKEARKSGVLLPVFLLVAMVIFSILKVYSNFPKAGLPGALLQYIIITAGLMISGLLLWYEIDKSNPILQKVCTGIAKTNCNAILSGSAAKVFSWLSWSEIGFFYYSWLMLLLIFPWYENPGFNLNIIAWLSVASLPYSIFSVYYQWRVARQWCLLCISIQVLLILGAATIVYQNKWLAIESFNLGNIVWSFLLLAPIPLAWFTIKPFLLRLQLSKHNKRRLQRIRFTPEIFETLLKRQKEITHPVEGLGITLGNPNASNELVKVCNPYCAPCSKAHPKIEKLIEQCTDLKVRIIFNVPDNEAFLQFKPVTHLLAIADQGNESLIKQALDDWYSPKVKDYPGFAEKYKDVKELLTQRTKLTSMDRWCRDMNIMFTPTIFLNGYQLPDVYNIEELKYFLLK